MTEYERDQNLQTRMNLQRYQKRARDNFTDLVDGRVGLTDYDGIKLKSWDPHNNLQDWL